MLAVQPDFWQDVSEPIKPSLPPPLVASSVLFTPQRSGSISFQTLEASIFVSFLVGPTELCPLSCINPEPLCSFLSILCFYQLTSATPPSVVISSSLADDLALSVPKGVILKSGTRYL